MPEANKINWCDTENGLKSLAYPLGNTIECRTFGASTRPVIDPAKWYTDARHVRVAKVTPTTNPVAAVHVAADIA